MPSFKSRISGAVASMPGIRGAYHYAWAWLGSVRHGHPGRGLIVIGVTGTKGKTTTLELLNAMLEAGGERTALLSSLRVKVGDETRKNRTGNSMPGRGFIQKFFSGARRAGCRYALVEVTSQGVALHRHRFIEWDFATLTNLAPEHIDWHGSYENYRAAKLEFLLYVARRGGRVFLNRDDKEYDFYREALERASRGGGAVMKEGSVSYSRLDEGAVRSFERTDGPQEFVLSDFNKENAAAAIALAKACGIKEEAIDRALAEFRGVPGRMEFVRRGAFTAVVDYAHTPESLEAAYRAARPVPDALHEHPRLICVLSSAGGGRDRWKRPAMGEIATRYCDEIFVTNEDPYDEDPRAIMREIVAGMDGARKVPVHVVDDRREAIRAAVAGMREGDVVIGTGKGSEESIHGANGTSVPWNESAVFEEELARRAGRAN
ncbi:MAG TPA: UDP-N-acetylmuramyl-tripeptide synthetase [Candidatus Paceibacterota bacterium]|nr:UDP-N-acetylmuramyl-tripeptide synthetase [Candidatus Paceibacterota bacterium]